MHPITANTSTTFTLSPAAASALTWVRLDNGRLLPVATDSGEFITLIDTSAVEADGVNEDGVWDLPKVLSYALCGDEHEFEAVLDDIMYTPGHRCLGNGVHRVEAHFMHWNQRDQFAWCQLLTLEEVKAMDTAYVAEGLGVSIAELPIVLSAVGNVYADECVIELAGGREIRCPASPADCSYVRITLPGIVPLELAYWNSDEWAEAPAEVMGAILGAARGRA